MKHKADIIRHSSIQYMVTIYPGENISMYGGLYFIEQHSWEMKILIHGNPILHTNNCGCKLSHLIRF